MNNTPSGTFTPNQHVVSMTAVGAERISATTGWALKSGDFSVVSPNLPQRVAVLCEANDANQSDLDTSEWQATSLKAVGARYGYGSPAYAVARIMLPLLGGIPLVYYPQEAANGATAQIKTLTPTGVATANATHTVIVAGRKGVDAQSYNFTVNVGDTSADITGKIADALNAVLGCPYSAADTEYEVVLTSRWSGLTANGLDIDIETNGNDAGITYAVTDDQAGAGTPDIADALESMKSKWNTVVVNTYGLETTICDALEAWNGIPDDTTPTGQYVGTVMKPAIVICGTVSEDESTFTDARKDQVTLALAPAPNSPALAMEAAANAAALQAITQQNTPELDIIYMSYPDMPVPADGNIGAMSDYNERDRIVKLGCSTVDLVNGKYQIIDFVTTYHPEGELVPAYRYVRDLSIAFQIRFNWSLIENLYIKGKVIVNDDDTVNKDKQTIRPSTVKALAIDMAEDLIGKALIVDATFFKQNLTVQISSTNKDRIDTSFKTKISGIARINATENTIGFNYGSNS